MTWQTGITTALRNDPFLKTFLPPVPPVRIFYGRIPPGVKVPFISWFSTGGPPPDWTFEADYIETVTFQVSIWHESPDVASTIARRVDHLLCWQPIAFDDVRNMAIERTSPLDHLLLDPDQDEIDQDVWQIPLLYQARLIRKLDPSTRGVRVFPGGPVLLSPCPSLADCLPEETFPIGGWDPPLDFYNHITVDAPDGIVSLDYSSRGEFLTGVDLTPPDHPIPYTFGDDYYACQTDCSRQRVTLTFKEPGTYFYRARFDSGGTDIAVYDVGAVNHPAGPNELCAKEDRRVYAALEGFDYWLANGHFPEFSAQLPGWAGVFATSADAFADLTDLCAKINAKSAALGRPINVYVESHGSTNLLQIGSFTDLLSNNATEVTFQQACKGSIARLYFVACCTGEQDAGGEATYTIQILANDLFTVANPARVEVAAWEGVVTVFREGAKRRAYVGLNASAKLRRRFTGG